MFNLDPGKLLVIAVVAIILLGPDRLPQVARQVGGAWRSFNEFRHRMESEVRSSMPDLPPTSEIARLARSPSALLDHLSNMSSDDDRGQRGAGRLLPAASVRQWNGRPGASGGGPGRERCGGCAADAGTNGAAASRRQRRRGAPRRRRRTSNGAGTVRVQHGRPVRTDWADHAAWRPPPAPSEVIVPGDPTLN